MQKAQITGAHLARVPSPTLHFIPRDEHYGTSEERFKYISAYSSCQGRNVDLHALEGSSPGKVEKCEVDWLTLGTELTQIRSLVTQMYWLLCGRLLQAARKQGPVKVIFSIGVFPLIVSLILNILAWCCDSIHSFYIKRIF